MNVIFIAMEFAPINSAGIYRPIRFLNSMVENGISPLVVTFEQDENLMKVQSNADPGLLNLVHPSVKIIRVPLDDISVLTKTKLGRIRYVMNNVSGDNFLHGWENKIYQAIDQLIKDFSPKAIITSCPPFSSAILARNISKIYHLPFIIDMRDAWSEWGMAPNASYFHYLRKKKIERSVFRQASKITSVTPQLIDKFKTAHPGINIEKFELIYNSPNFSIDPNFSVELKSINDVERIDIGYTGSFYFSEKVSRLKPHQFFQYYPGKEDWLYRTPYYFFKSIHHLFLRHPEWKKKVFINFIGSKIEWIHDMTIEFGLEDNVIFHGYQTQENVRILESQFDILLSTSEKVTDGEHYCLPSKLFTYLLAKKPIFAFVTEGIQKEFISNTGIGIVFDPDETDQTILQLENILKDGWKSNFNSNYFHEFEEKTTSGKFVDLINKIRGNKSGV